MFGGPSVKSLTRIDLDALWKKEQQEATNRIAREAADKLGYRHFERTIDENTAKAQLHTALRDLGIRPFDKEGVKKYQAAMVKRHSTLHQTASWHSNLLSNYTEAVPEFVLATALRVKERLPDAQFSVEYLSIANRPSPDPFLLVTIAVGASPSRNAVLAQEYLEVWNEPDFTAGRTI